MAFTARCPDTLGRWQYKRAVLVGSIHLSDKEISRALYEKNARYVDEVEASFATSGLRAERLHGSSPDVDLKLPKLPDNIKLPWD